MVERECTKLWPDPAFRLRLFRLFGCSAITTAKRLEKARVRIFGQYAVASQSSLRGGVFDIDDSDVPATLATHCAPFTLTYRTVGENPVPRW